MGNSGKFRFHYLEHESKMRLLKTHSHTSERLDYEARKNAKKIIEGNVDTVLVMRKSRGSEATEAVFCFLQKSLFMPGCIQGAII